MKLHVRISTALAIAASIAGCAGPQPSTAPAAVVTPLQARLIPANRADTITIGRSRADVVAALGETLVISFESGYEVWVYRLAGGSPGRIAPDERPARNGAETQAEPATGEFVVLFAPSGLVARTRIRAGSTGEARSPSG